MRKDRCVPERLEERVIELAILDLSDINNILILDLSVWILVGS